MMLWAFLGVTESGDDVGPFVFYHEKTADEMRRWLYTNHSYLFDGCEPDDFYGWVTSWRTCSVDVE